MSDLQYSTQIDSAQAQMMELRDLRCQVHSKASKEDVIALQGALSHKANQAEFCTVQAQIAGIQVELARKADKCDLIRTQDSVAALASGQSAFALKYEVQAIAGNVQGLSANFASATADNGSCDPVYDKRLTHLARALAAIHCGIRDDRVRVDTVIAAVTDAATKSALQALADSVFSRWDQILVQFVSITGGCDGNG